jgi:hypothetical protein
MAMIRIIIGVGLMVIAFVILFLFIGGPENPLVANIMTALNCQPGERFVQVLGGYVYNSDGSSGQEFNFYCQSEIGRRDVTGQGVVEGIVGYLVPFLTGLGLTLTGSFAVTRRRSKTAVSAKAGFTSPSSTQTDPFGNPINITDFQADVTGQPLHMPSIITMNGKQTNFTDLPPETAQKIEQTLGKLGMMMTSGTFTMHSGDLSDKLQQLQEARDKNLITQEEYDRIRTEILTHME